MHKKKLSILLALTLAGISLGWGAGQDRQAAKKAEDSRLKTREAQVERLKWQQRLPQMRREAAARLKQQRAQVLARQAKARREATPSGIPDLGPLAASYIFWPFVGPESGPMAGLDPAAGAAAAAQAALAPTANPRGIPHYFGPIPNYANSPLPRGSITAINVIAPGSGYVDPVVIIEDAYFTGSGAVATATLNATGGIASIAVSGGTNYSAPVVYIADAANVGTGADALAVIGPPFTLNTGLRKFVDGLPQLTAAGANNLGQYIPVAIPDTTTYPGSHYYEIELGEYTERLHSDLQPTLLRGYRQTNTDDATVSQFHNLGPLIVAQHNIPVRIRFTNKLPISAGGNLFIPVDTTLMGAGATPNGTENYTQNRAELHLHGGDTPWISDGTPYQWTTPAGEVTNYPHGVSVYNVPDMVDSGRNPPQGILTYFYPNQQSARLMFYHDHAVGITRLNVYAGEAAGYLLTDAVENDLITGSNVTGVNPGGQPLLPDVGVPLIIQDKSFVDPATIVAQDPTWAWGQTPGIPVLGDLWMPHVYMPNQNPADLSGMNAFGRWHYGPWFWPPTGTITFPPIPNPYVAEGPWENATIPAAPNPSMAMEAFMDTPLVNGTVYPYMEVEPKLYRFRILNACNDRFVNLQLYKADPAIPTADGQLLNTEVRMVPAVANAAYPPDWPRDGREGGVPDPAMMGPNWVQIGTEGGFLPAPVVIPPQPVDWNLNATNFNFGNVSKYSLLLGPAERADVLVDFTNLNGQTLILYNDAPAAFPALDPRYDYYTGNVDQVSSGGTPPTLAGYGPNTRTIMQIRVVKPVSGTPVALNMAGLNNAFQKGPAKPGVFEVSQPPVIVPEARYNGAYAGSFPADPFVRIFEASKTFQALDGSVVTIPFQPKAIQDEMGEAYDIEYGRMSGFLGVQLPATAGQQRFTLFPYGSPPIEIIKAETAQSVPLAGDGTQIWKITHNGVDTHTIHFHMFNVQLINRVAWDNAVGIPDPNELGWKETVRVNPLEDTIVALRPVLPTIPFDLPNSVRPIDLSKPLGAVLMGGPMGFKDPQGNPVSITNHDVNWGWEYVLHCHLLGHEEMDMMHGQSIVVAPRAPTGLAAARGAGGVSLTWVDNSLNETGFTVERAADPDFLTTITSLSVGADVTALVDPSAPNNVPLYYRVLGTNLVGDFQTLGFPVMTAASGYSNVVTIPADLAPLAPTDLTAQLRNGSGIRLRWLDNATNETGFVIERAASGSGSFAQIAVFAALPGTGQQGNYTDGTVLPGNTYDYRVAAVNGAVYSAYSNVVTIANGTAPVAPLAPTAVEASGFIRNRNSARISVIWNDASNNETGFEIQIATDAAFTTIVSNGTATANQISYTSGNLLRGTSYYVRVRAVNGTSPSAWVNATQFPVITP